jgi:inhibitor of KinA
LPDESAAVALRRRRREGRAPPWLQDVVPAYASVGVFFDADRIGTA